MGKPRIVDVHTVAEGRFLSFDLVEYADSKGSVRKWEAVQRCKGQEAVYIVAVMVPSNRLLVIRQFRPPISGFCLECPAGLIDDGETAVMAAPRELFEETGYHGTVIWTSNPSTSSAGMTGELVTLVQMTVDENAPENQNVTQHLDSGEEIEVHAIPLDQLGKYIAQCQKNGDLLDSRLAAWAAGAGIRW